MTTHICPLCRLQLLAYGVDGLTCYVRHSAVMVFLGTSLLRTVFSTIARDEYHSLSSSSCVRLSAFMHTYSISIVYSLSTFSCVALSCTVQRLYVMIRNSNNIRALFILKRMCAPVSVAFSRILVHTDCPFKPLSSVSLRLKQFVPSGEFVWWDLLVSRI